MFVNGTKAKLRAKQGLVRSENEACLYRESRSEYMVEMRNEPPTISLVWNSSRAGYQTHAERKRVGALADNMSRHEIVAGLVSKASPSSLIFPTRLLLFSFRTGEGGEGYG